ncbi:MAG: hypothetical protein MZU79_09140 [Anaerotruncus sp.]|nr:hypothetical protein [Anaerotruncus sp.]
MVSGHGAVRHHLLPGARAPGRPCDRPWTRGAMKEAESRRDSRLRRTWTSTATCPRRRPAEQALASPSS